MHTLLSYLAKTSAKCQCDSLLHNHTESHTYNILIGLMSVNFNSDDSCFNANLLKTF